MTAEEATKRFTSLVKANKLKTILVRDFPNKPTREQALKKNFQAHDVIL